MVKLLGAAAEKSDCDEEEKRKGCVHETAHPTSSSDARVASSFLLLESFLLLAAMPGAPCSVLAPSSDALCS